MKVKVKLLNVLFFMFSFASLFVGSFVYFSHCRPFLCLLAFCQFSRKHICFCSGHVGVGGLFGHTQGSVFLFASEKDKFKEI